MSVALELGVSQDVAFISSDGPCTRASQLDAGWSCFRARGDQYHGTPQGGRLPAGPAAGPTRLLLGAEIVWESFALGVRGGWSFRGMGPPSDGTNGVTPFGGELFVRYELTSSSAFRLDLLGIAGGRILDAHATDTVYEDRSVAPSAYQLDNPDKQNLDAYKRIGTGFVGAGVAASFTLSTATALRFELPLSVFFPSTGVAVSPTALLVVTP